MTASEQPISAKTGFHTRKHNPEPMSDVRRAVVTQEANKAVDAIVNFGLYVENGEYFFHDNVDRVHHAISPILSDVDTGGFGGVTSLKLQLVQAWKLAYQPTRHNNPLLDPKQDGLKEMTRLLKSLSDAGYDKMPMGKDNSRIDIEIYQGGMHLGLR